MFSRFMPIPDFPFSRDAASRYLPWIIGGLSFLAAILLFSAVSMQAQLSANRAHMSRMVTIHIPANLDVPQSLLVGQTQDILNADKNVAKSVQVGQTELRALVSPWLGSTAAQSEALPLPVLLEVEMKPEANAAALTEEIQRLHAGIRVQSYAAWLEDYLHTLRLMQLATLALAILLLAVCALVVMFAARMSLTIHHPAVNLLHSFGATPDYIARQFQWHAAQLALKGALPGIALGGILFTLLGLTVAGKAGETLLPDMRWSLGHAFCLIVLLGGTAGIAIGAARRSVLRGLLRPAPRAAL